MCIFGHLCLVHIWPAMGLRSPYPARTDSRAPRILWFCLAESYTNLKNRKSVARRHVVGGIAQSPHRHRALKNGTVAPRSLHQLLAASARKLHGLRTITVWRLRRLHGNSTEIAPRAASVRIYPGLPLRARTRNCMMLIDNVNTYMYTVAHSHLRCPKNCTENHRQIYRTVPGPNVN